MSGMCGAMTESGTPCKRRTSGALCAAHDPSLAAQRSKAARFAAISRWSEEVSSIKDEVREVIADVGAGDLEAHRGTVMFQGYRLLRELEVDMREARALDELEAQLAELRSDYEGVM
jgi:hypothetical protein